MAKGQKRSNREIRKPKKSAAQRSAEVASATAIGAASIAVGAKKKR